MRFRVTSITGSEEGALVGGVTVALEDSLNEQLSQRDFGSNLDQVSIVVVSAFDEILQNERWAASRCRLGHLTNQFTAERIRSLSFGVPVKREVVLCLHADKLSSYIRAEIVRVVSVRPRRVAAGLDYPALSSAIEEVAVKHANSAA